MTEMRRAFMIPNSTASTETISMRALAVRVTMYICIAEYSVPNSATTRIRQTTLLASSMSRVAGHIPTATTPPSPASTASAAPRHDPAQVPVVSLQASSPVGMGLMMANGYGVSFTVNRGVSSRYGAC